MNRRELMRTMAAASLGAWPGVVRAGEVDALGAAVAGAVRSEKNRARDPWRHPAQTLAFWGLKPGMTVVEIEPAGGYWTQILAPYLKATGGRYIAATGGDLANFQSAYADEAVWGRIMVVPFDEKSGPLGPAGAADLVITARNIHDWMWTPGFLAKALADVHAVLKPGGLLGVEEHRADPRPMIDNAHDGYVSTAFLTGAVETAGFRLQASSEINANPKDTKDHPFGVWTLPPTRRTHAKDQPSPPGFDAAKYEAIGESDRMTLRFARV